MRYNWRQGDKPEAAALAWPLFKRAAEMGHRRAKRALALMAFDGRGTEQNREGGLQLLWEVFRECDREALSELGECLGSYSEAVEDQSARLAADQAAGHVDEILQQVEALDENMRALRQGWIEKARPPE